MNLVTVLIILLVLALIGVLPTYGYSRTWGAYPSVGVGTVLAIVLILWLIGVL